MSLIAEALKKAQQGAGAIRKLPPFSFKQPLSGLPGGWGEGPWARLGYLVGGLGLIVIVLIGSLYLVRLGSAPVAPPSQPVLVVESPALSSAPGPPAQVPARPPAPAAAPAPKPEQGTSIPEVRAALEAEPGQKPRQSEAGLPVTSPRRADPRREVALSRVKEALREEAKQGDKPIREPVSPPSLSAPRAAEPPPSPPLLLEVHPDGAKEAAKFFAEALRYQQQGQLSRAVEEYEKSIAVDPRNPAAFNNLGVALKESGRLDLASEAFQKALALDPKYEKALNNLGVIRYRKGQYEEAIDLFKQALRINSANVESYTNLGVIYLMAERYDDALEAFRQGLRHDPKLAEAHYNLGLLWERRGNRENAQRHYQKFVELASDRHAVLVAKVKERLQVLARGR